MVCCIAKPEPAIEFQGLSLAIDFMLARLRLAFLAEYLPDMPDESASSAPLDYAPPSPKWWKRVYRWLIVVAAIFALPLCIKPSIWAWQRMQLRYQIRQCLKHPIAQGALVYSSDNPAAALDSPEEIALERLETQFFGDFSSGTIYGTKPTLTSSTVFMGELQACNGTRSFIHIEAAFGSDAQANAVIELKSRSLSPEGIMGVSNPSEASPCPKKLRPAMLLYSAVRDPSDPSHIYFQYRTYCETHRVDGYLNAMGGFDLTDKVIGP